MPQPEGSQPESRGSPRGPTSESPVGSHTTWAQHVRWDTPIRSLDDPAYNHLPEAKKLRELVQQSFTIPAWLVDLQSPQYDPYRRTERFWLVIKFSHSRFSAPAYTHDKEDKSLATDVEECFPNLLQIVRHASTLKSTGPDPMEADWRHSMDTLGTLIWDIQSSGLIYRLERQLQMPGPFSSTKPDACTFIVMTADTDPPALIEGDIQPALSCLATTVGSPPEPGYILHWVTEFKPHHDEEPSKCQVVQGLVSALYQRRALGFPKHFVFGTAHHSRTVLEVLAATWVPSECVDPGAPSTQEAQPQHVTPAVDQENNPEVNLPQGGGTTNDKSGVGQKFADADAELTIEDIKHGKIVVYSLGKYSMQATTDMLRLYLLMRQTRVLVKQYKDEIMKYGVDKITQLLSKASEIYRWPPAPLPESDRGSTTRSTSNKRRKRDQCLDGIPEANDSMSIDQDNHSDSDSDLEDLDSLSDIDCGYTVTANVAKWRVNTYSDERDTGAYTMGDP